MRKTRRLPPKSPAFTLRQAFSIPQTRHSLLVDELSFSPPVRQYLFDACIFRVSSLLRLSWNQLQSDLEPDQFQEILHQLTGLTGPSE